MEHCMERIMETIASNPLYLILAVVIGIMVLWAILNRLIKAAVIIFIGIIVYAGYITYQGKQIPGNGREVVQQGKEELDNIKKIGIDILKDFIIESMSREKPEDESSTTLHQHTPRNP